MERAKMAAVVKNAATLDIIVVDGPFTQDELEKMLTNKGHEVVLCTTMTAVENQLRRMLNIIEQNKHRPLSP